MTCQTLPPVSVSTGNVTLSTDGLSMQATYACPVGYVVNGATTLTCGSDGTWDAGPSDCGRYTWRFSFVVLHS